MEKTYIYKYFQNNQYVGVLNNVISQFELEEQINTVGSQIEIELATTFDEAGSEIITSLLVTEDGDYIVTDDGERIIVDTEVDLGDLPGLANRLEVWEVSEDNPTGKRMFNGLITKIVGSYKQQSIRLTALSYGVQFDNYLVQIAPGDTLISNLNIDDTEILYPVWKTTLNRIIGVAQTFTVGVNTEINSIYITIGNPGTMSTECKIEIYEGTPNSPGAVIGSVTRNIPSQENISTQFSFTSPISLVGSRDYFFTVDNMGFSISDTQVLSVGVDTTSSFVGGAMYTYNDSTGYATAGYDMGFIMVSSSGGVGNQFLSYDPSQIARELVDNFNAVGGVPTYTDASIEDSGTEVSYTFKFNTYLEAIQKVVELEPADWWFHVDSANNILTLKPLPQEVSHTFIIGKHIEDLTLEYSIENIINTIWFTGGDVAGTNLLVSESNQTSVANYGVWLDKPSDNRVTDEETASILSNSKINQYKDPKFYTKISIASTTYDITSINVGELVGFANGNNLINNLQLQVMSKRYTPDLVTLDLAILPPTVSKRIEDIKRNLDKKITENNPDV